MAGIDRDTFGVPHVRAGSVTEVARAQGVVTAQDRSWQLELQRRRATGTAAAVLGEAYLPWDRLARRTRLAEQARGAHAGLRAETKDFLAAYVDGVNEGLTTAPELERLGIEAEPWEVWTPVGVFLAQHLLFGGLGSNLWDHRLLAVLGDDAALLSHEGPESSGSNAWAVGGARTATGFPLIGGDPHRYIEAPGVYQQVRLVCEDPDDPFDVVGFTFPGVPGVQHFAHAGEVAWAITNAMADYQDVYAERLRVTAGGVEAFGPGGWEPVERGEETIEVRGGAPEVVEVLVTLRGPVFEGGTATGEGLSLRAATAVLADVGFDALLPLLRARSVDDVDRALDGWVEPVNNVVIADRSGVVRYRVAGAVPTRGTEDRWGILDPADPATAWTGWLEPLPRHDVPADGQVVTANERRGPESDAIGSGFAPPHRAARIHALLDGRDDLTAADFARIHGDTRLPTYDQVRTLLDRLTPGPAGAEVRKTILDWDGRMDAGSRGAAAYAAWRGALARRIAAEPVLAPLREPSPHDPVFDAWMVLTNRVGLALEGLVAAGRPFGIDLDALATEALDDAAGHAATWGDTHVLVPLHAFAVAGLEMRVPTAPVSGDTDCVRCTGSLPGITDECWRGSVARYVWDLADRTAGGWVVPLGAHGDPGHEHHHDQLPLWLAADLAPIVTDPAEPAPGRVVSPR